MSVVFKFKQTKDKYNKVIDTQKYYTLTQHVCESSRATTCGPPKWDYKYRIQSESEAEENTVRLKRDGWAACQRLCSRDWSCYAWTFNEKTPKGGGDCMRFPVASLTKMPAPPEKGQGRWIAGICNDALEDEDIPCTDEADQDCAAQSTRPPSWWADGKKGWAKGGCDSDVLAELSSWRCFQVGELRSIPLDCSDDVLFLNGGSLVHDSWTFAGNWQGHKNVEEACWVMPGRAVTESVYDSWSDWVKRDQWLQCGVTGVPKTAAQDFDTNRLDAAGEVATHVSVKWKKGASSVELTPYICKDSHSPEPTSSTAAPPAATAAPDTATGTHSGQESFWSRIINRRRGASSARRRSGSRRRIGGGGTRRR
ncbi:unnamed protein product [Amoebophrya sp. A120]|nr:unnamed protein product [Amoebophrya sp. A120]|eukprot:GSA120T00012370001.1